MSWVVFSYSLPSAGRSSPRVAVWRRLRAVGAIVPKGGVHVLPARDDCVEAFQWLAQEVEQAKGDALLFRVERFEGLSDAQLIELFQEARKRDYDALDARAADLEKSLDAKQQGVSLGLLDLLSEPLEGLDALVARGQDVHAPLGGDGAQGAQAAPDSDPRARPPRGREGVGEHDPRHLTLTRVSYVAIVCNRYCLHHGDQLGNAKGDPSCAGTSLRLPASPGP